MVDDPLNANVNPVPAAPAASEEYEYEYIELAEGEELPDDAEYEYEYVEEEVVVVAPAVETVQMSQPADIFSSPVIEPAAIVAASEPIIGVADDSQLLEPAHNEESLSDMLQDVAINSVITESTIEEEVDLEKELFGMTASDHIDAINLKAPSFEEISPFIPEIRDEPFFEPVVEVAPVVIAEPEVVIALEPIVEAPVVIAEPEVIVPEPIVEAQVVIAEPEVVALEPIVEAPVVIAEPEVIVPEPIVEAQVVIAEPEVVAPEPIVEAPVIIEEPVAVVALEPIVEAPVVIAEPEFVVLEPIVEAPVVVAEPEVVIAPEPIVEAPVVIAEPEVVAPEPIVEAPVVIAEPEVVAPELIINSEEISYKNYTLSEEIYQNYLSNSKIFNKLSGIQKFQTDEKVKSIVIDDVDYAQNELENWGLIIFKKTLVKLAPQTKEIDLPSDENVVRYARVVKDGHEELKLFDESKFNFMASTAEFVKIKGHFIYGQVDYNTGMIVDDFINISLNGCAGQLIIFAKPVSGILTGPNNAKLYFNDLGFLLIPSAKLAAVDEEKQQIKNAKWYSGSLNDKYFELSSANQSTEFVGTDEIKAIHVNVGSSTYGWNVTFDNGIVMSFRDMQEFQTKHGSLPSRNGTILHGQLSCKFSNLDKIVVYETAQYFAYGRV